jgi:hypothetical protein
LLPSKRVAQLRALVRDTSGNLAWRAGALLLIAVAAGAVIFARRRRRLAEGTFSL